MNSRTPQCEVRSAAVLWTSKSIGYSICRDARRSRADGGIITEKKKSNNHVIF